MFASMANPIRDRPAAAHTADGISTPAATAEPENRSGAAPGRLSGFHPIRLLSGAALKVRSGANADEKPDCLPWIR
jgi:hypothetical protein